MLRAENFVAGEEVTFSLDRVRSARLAVEVAEFEAELNRMEPPDATRILRILHLQ